MESLALPQDLHWETKLEPISPHNGELLTSICEDLGENWLTSNDDFVNDLIIISEDDLDFKHNDLDLAEALLSNEDFVMEFYDLKEENFYSPTPLLDSSIDSTISNPLQAVKVLAEINHFGFANQNSSVVLTQLTPPCSPPQTAVPSPLEAISPPLETVTTTCEQVTDVLQPKPALQHPQIHTPFGFNNWNNNNHQNSTTADESSEDDIEFHTQIINDILKSAADKIFEDGESQSSISGPTSQADYSDDEWVPSSGSCSPLQNHATESSSDCSSGSSSPIPPKKRTRPYGRGVEDRKIRKKEQNKNAATRYRLKKKLEMEYILVEEQELNKRHEELKSELAERKREAKYLKTLIREFYAKKKM
uniref:Putative cyclic amp-dependent transcription factor atf-4 n=1 Tax=Haematobia irritans TaxID=7368 RepID=A0A1L8EIC4_HAEIR